MKNKIIAAAFVTLLGSMSANAFANLEQYQVTPTAVAVSNPDYLQQTFDIQYCTEDCYSIRNGKLDSKSTVFKNLISIFVNVKGGLDYPAFIGRDYYEVSKISTTKELSDKTQTLYLQIHSGDDILESGFSQIVNSSTCKDAFKTKNLCKYTISNKNFIYYFDIKKL